MTMRSATLALLAGVALLTGGGGDARGQVAPEAPTISIPSGRTHVVDTATDIERVAVSSPEVADIVVVSPRTVMLNGKAPGETSAVIWLTNGTRIEYDVKVKFAASRMDAAAEQVRSEFGDKVQLTGDAMGVYLTGTVRDLYASARAESIAATVGKVVNLLKVEMPPQEQEILLKVRFADVDRSKSLSLGANILGTPGGFPVNVTTGSNSPSRFTSVTPPTYTLSDALNVLMFDPHANLMATIQALQATNVLQILAEPNLLAMNGHTATFVSGGEFPYPTLQGGGSGVGQVTIQFRDFGIKLKFTPTITPRGTIRLHVAPEVSSLDYADALTISGGTVPALTTRRVETDVELENGQSFAIGGLLDQSTTDTLSKIPGLGDIPILGKFFQSRSVTKSNSELIVIVTPELVAPVAVGQPLPDLKFPTKFLDGPGVMSTPPQTPGPEQTGPPPTRPVRQEIPVQEMEKILRDEQLQNQQNGGAASGTGGTGYGTGFGTGMSGSAGDTMSVPMPQAPASPTPAVTTTQGPNQ